MSGLRASGAGLSVLARLRGPARREFSRSAASDSGQQPSGRPGEPYTGRRGEAAGALPLSQRLQGLMILIFRIKSRQPLPTRGSQQAVV